MPIGKSLIESGWPPDYTQSIHSLRCHSLGSGVRFGGSIRALPANWKVPEKRSSACEVEDKSILYTDSGDLSSGDFDCVGQS